MIMSIYSYQASAFDFLCSIKRHAGYRAGTTRRKTMKRKLLIHGLVIIVLAGLCSCGLHTHYGRVPQKSGIKNPAMEKTVSAPAVDLAGPQPGWTEEVLIGVFADRHDLVIRVSSGGCTGKDDFRIWRQVDKASKAGDPHYLLTIYRVRTDACKAMMPNGIEITYRLKEDLGLPPIFTYTLTNRLGGSPYSR